MLSSTSNHFFVSVMGNSILPSKAFMESTGPVIHGPGMTTEYVPFTLPKLDQRQQDAVDRARKYAMEQSIKNVLLKQTQQHQQQQMSHLKRTQALVLLSRIYIGSISYELKEETIRAAFCPFGAIKTVSLSWDALTNKHKGFAFIEYDLPEAAQLALDQMNNVMLGGRNIKVGRPSNMPQAQPITDELTSDPSLQNRVYVASVHLDLNPDDLKSVFEAFGRVVSCELIPDPTNPSRHRGYGYIEYETPQSAADAVSSMNLFDLGGQYLRVGKAITPKDTGSLSITGAVMPPAAAVAAASVTAKVIAMEVEQVHKGFGVSPTSTAAVPSHAPALPPPTVVMPKPVGLFAATNSTTTTSSWDDVEKIEKAKTTGDRVMVLRNMVGPEDCDDDLEAEVAEECSKFGNVKRVLIYQEFEQGIVIKIFVMFEDPESLYKAVDSLNGRFFGGRIVNADVYSQELFEANDLSH